MATNSPSKRLAKAAADAVQPQEQRQALRRNWVDAAYLRKPAHLRTRQERLDAGKALRVSCPRESQAGFRPAADRPDPIDRLVQSSAGRIEAETEPA